MLDLYSFGNQGLVSDIVEGAEGGEVWGVVYELDRELVFRSDGGRSVMDRIEGHRTERDPENYKPAFVRLKSVTAS